MRESAAEAGEALVKGFECLGACDLAPMASIDDVYFGPLDPGDAATALEQLRAGEEVLPIRRSPSAGSPAVRPRPIRGSARARPALHPRASDDGGRSTVTDSAPAAFFQWDRETSWRKGSG